MKTLLFHLSEHKYIMLAIVSAGFAYYLSSNWRSPKEYPDDIKQTLDIANQFLMQKQYQEALINYDRVLHYDPHCAVAHFNKGQAFMQQEKWPEAAACYENALKYNITGPFLYLVHFNYGTVLFRLDKFEQAKAQLDQSIALQWYTPAYAQRGMILEKLGRLDEAYDDLKKACALESTFAKGLIKVGNSYRNKNNFMKAIECYHEASQYIPNDCSLHLCLGDAFHLQGRVSGNQEYIAQAVAMYRKAIEINPQCHLAYHNLGCMHMEQDREEEAFAFMKKALECEPDHNATHLLLSCYYLKKGDFERGWREYEWRNKGLNPNRHQYNPAWDGTPLTDKTVLLHAEQGFGDTFQFIRYAQLVKEQQNPKMLIVEVQHALKKIASLCPYIDKVIIPSDPMPTYDVQASLMSLPFILRTKLSTIPHAVPYLYASEHLTNYWHTVLSTNHTFKIGICWQVNPHHDVLKYQNDNVTISIPNPSRSIPLAAFAPLANLTNITIYSLQKEINGREAVPAGLHIESFGADFDKSHGAFMDTAAIMKNLDLVITADTSIAHLAGGLGVPVWILLPYACEWRWLHERKDSLWYPTMRLFRQKERDNWAPVMQEVCRELVSIIP